MNNTQLKYVDFPHLTDIIFKPGFNSTYLIVIRGNGDFKLSSVAYASLTERFPADRLDVDFLTNKEEDELLRKKIEEEKGPDYSQILGISVGAGSIMFILFVAVITYMIVSLLSTLNNTRYSIPLFIENSGNL